MKYLKLSKLFLIIGVFLLCTFIYYPFNENKSLGDISDSMDYPFEVKWDDKDHESNRPSSITYNLYNILDENTIVSTVTLTSSNADSNDSNKWNGTFENITKYNSDESNAEYIIKQSNVANYIQGYDRKSPNAFCIEFGNNVFDGDTSSYISFYNYQNGFVYYSPIENVNVNNREQLKEAITFGYDELRNNTVCAPLFIISNIQIDIKINGNSNLDIKKIYPYNLDNYYFIKESTVNTYISFNSRYYDNPKTNKDNFRGSNIIVNKWNKTDLNFEVEWDDKNYESNRPSSITYNVYNISDENTIISSVTLTSSNADSNDNSKWIGEFENLKKYSDYETTNEYIIKEADNINNYLTKTIDANHILNSYKYYDYKFEIEWDDNGYETERPSSITYDLYNVLDNNTVVSTISLTSSNIDSLDIHKWNGTFVNVPKYNNDDTKAEYIIKYREEPNEYLVQYKLKESFNSLCIEFGNNVLNNDSAKNIKFVANTSYPTTYWYYHQFRYVMNGDSSSFQSNDLNNKKICIPIIEKDNAIYFAGDIYNLDIKNIYPSTINEQDYKLNNSHFDMDKTCSEYTNNNYPNNDSEKCAKYKWDSENGSKKNFKSANIIKYSKNKFNLKFDKYWEDEGHENLRPSSSEFYLYKKNDQNNILKTITLTSSNVDSSDSSHWIGSFDNIDRYDDNGKRIEYVVREKQIPNYINSYDSKEGLSITFNENTKFGYELAATIYYHDKDSDKWYSLELYSDALGDQLGGKTINIRMPNDDRFIEKTKISDDSYMVNHSIFRTVKEFVGTNYPEMYHDTALNDNYAFHYSNSLSNHSQDFYFYYRGDSWSMDYGLKIDNISTLGDEVVITSRINLRDLEIKKVWEDEGHESIRPNTVEIDILNANNPTEIIRTINITSQDKVDNYNWKKTITDLPIYDNNLQEIEYMISEKKTNDDYLIVYDADDYYNGLEITFDDNLFGFDYVYMGYQMMGSYAKISKRGGYVNYFPQRDTQYGLDSWGDSLSGRKVQIPTRHLYMYYYFSSYYRQDSIYKLKIVNIEPTHFDFYDNDTVNFRDVKQYKKSYFDDYLDFYGNYDPNIILRYYWEYEWIGSLTPKKNCFVIKNKYNKIDFEFTKKWDTLPKDNDETITFDIYNDLDKNKVLSTVVLSKNDVNPNNNKEWIGVFKDLPKYNDDGFEAQYIIKEANNDSYKTRYDLKDRNGFCVDIDFDEKWATTDYIHFYVYNEDDNNYYKIVEKGIADNTTIYPYDKTICFEAPSDKFYVYEYYQYIKRIYPVYRENYDYVIAYQTSVNPYTYKLYTDNQYLDFDESGRTILYSWSGSSIPFPGADTIYNYSNIRNDVIEKKFNDDGNEYNRPKNIVFGLYGKDDSMLKEMVTLDTSTCVDNKCNIEFKKVIDKDNEGNKLEYEIKEISDYGYDVTYSIDDKKELYNSLCVKFGSDVHMYGSINLLFQKDNNNYFIKNKESGNTSFNQNDVKNKNICIPTPEKYEFYIYGTADNLNIEEIYPNFIDYDESDYVQTDYSTEDPLAYSGDSYPKMVVYAQMDKYTYEFPIRYEITNTANPIEVKFKKETPEGKALKGAKFELYNKDGDKIKEFNSLSREVSVKLLPSEYTLKEIEPPEGYERSKDIHIKVNREGSIEQDGNTVSVVKVVDEPIKETYSISLKKTIKGNENRDFTFEITIVGFNGSLSYTGDREGTLEFTNNKATVKLGTGQTITINNIPVNSKYTVNEIDEGYLTTIVGDKEGILNRNETIEFINTPREIPGNGEVPIPEEKTVPTPITGIFNILSYISGAILLILSIFLIVYAKKQIKKKEIN